MKAVNLLLISLLPAGMATAQVSVKEDSLRTVVLREVNVSAKQKTHQQHLFQFFSANRAATTEDVLSRLPELSMVRRGNYGMEPVIRSYNSGQVNLLLDGMRIHGACTDKMDPASIYIEPANLQSIEVRTTGGNLLNGSSLGGSVNMKLAEASCHGSCCETGATFSGSSNTGFHSASRSFFQSLNLNYTTQKWGIAATGTYRKAGNYRDGSGHRVQFSQYEKVNYSLHGKFLLNHNTYLKVDLLADDGWNIGYAALPMDVGYANARIGAVSLVKENVPGGWRKIEAKLYANQVKHYMDDTQRPDVPMHMDMPGKSNTSGFYLEGTKSIGQRQSLTLRADASLTRLVASMTMYQEGQLPMYMLTWPDNRQVQTGVAAQYVLQLDSLTQLQFSARADYSDFGLTTGMGKDQLAVFGYSGANAQFFIPSVSAQVSRKLHRNLKATASLGFNGRTPTASELYGFYLFNQFDMHDYIGNPGLQQETAQQAELSLTWRKPKWKVQAAGYVSRAGNYIMGVYDPSLSVMTTGARGVKRYQNLDYAILTGAEGSVMYQPFPKTQVVSVLKYAYARNKEGDPLPMIAPLRNITTIRQHIGKLWLQGEMETAAAQRNVSKAANERETGDFQLFHFRLGYNGRFNNIPWQLNGGVENIFDAYYREHLDWGNVARQGRNCFLQFGISF